MTAEAPEAAFRPFAALGIRTTVARFAAAAALGAGVGAVLLAGIFHLVSPDATVSAYIRIAQPPDLVAVAGGAGQVTPNSQDNVDRYVAGEVAYLSGQGVSQAVAARLGKSDPVNFKVLQQGRSSVVTITSRSDDPADSERTVQAVLDYYSQQLAQRADQQLRIILPALTTWEQNAGEVAGAQGIRALRDRIQLQAAQSSVLTVLQQPALVDSKWHRWQIGAVLGTLLGASVSILLMLRRTRQVGLITVRSISGLVDEVLGPVVDLRQPPREAWTEDQVALARTLYAQLPSREPARVIVVLGASHSSGTAVVASLLRYAASENGPVAFIRLTNDSTPALRPLEGTTTVVNAGALGESNLISDAIAIATDLVIVIRLEVDAVTQVAKLLTATKSGGAPPVAILTDRPRGRQHRGKH